ENFRTIIDFAGRAMELKQVERLTREVSQTVLHPRGQVLPTIALHSLALKSSASFGRDKDRIFIIRADSLQLCDQTLAAAVAVHVGCVDEIDATIDRFVKRG